MQARNHIEEEKKEGADFETDSDYLGKFIKMHQNASAYARKKNKIKKKETMKHLVGINDDFRNRLTSKQNLARNNALPVPNGRFIGLMTVAAFREEVKRLPPDLVEFIFIKYTSGIPNNNILYNYLTRPKIRQELDYNFKKEQERSKLLSGLKELKNKENEVREVSQSKEESEAALEEDEDEDGAITDELNNFLGFLEKSLTVRNQEGKEDYAFDASEKLVVEFSKRILKSHRQEPDEGEIFDGQYPKVKVVKIRT